MAKKNNSSERKHLFGTSEKSDFILNMTGEGSQKLCAYYCIISLIIIALLAIPAYFTKDIVDYTVKLEDGSQANHYLSENFIFYSAAAVMLAGFIGFLIFMISCSKKQINLKNNKLLLSAAAAAILSCISCFCAKSIYTAVLGYLSRNEGLLSIIGYLGLFCAAMGASKDTFRVKLIDFIVGIGLFQSIIGILQAIPATSGAMGNFFEYLYVRPGSDSSSLASGQIVYDGGYSSISGIYTHSRAASGFITSPFALAALLCITFSCALGGAAFAKSKKRRIFYGISAPIMAAASFLTQVISGVIGIFTAAFIIIVIAVVKLIAKRNAASSVVICGVITAVCAICAALLFGTNTIEFNDESIIFTDGYVMRSITYAQRNDSDEGIYSYLRSDAQFIIEEFPITGVGPDNMPSYLTTYGISTDRFYNEYLDIAASRGILCLIAYAVFFVITIVKMLKALKNTLNGESWVPAAACAAISAYLVQAFFNTSWVNSTPYLYIMAGLVWSFTALGKKAKKN